MGGFIAVWLGSAAWPVGDFAAAFGSRDCPSELGIGCYHGTTRCVAELGIVTTPPPSMSLSSAFGCYHGAIQYVAELSTGCHHGTTWYVAELGVRLLHAETSAAPRSRQPACTHSACPSIAPQPPP